MLTGTPAYAYYGFLGPEEKTGIGYFGGIQFSKNSGLLTIRYEDMGLKQYTVNRTSPYNLPQNETKVGMKNTSFTISYAILFGAAKRIKRTNEILSVRSVEYSDISHKQSTAEAAACLCSRLLK